MKDKLPETDKKELLIRSAARLYSLGVDLESARERVKELVAAGISYDSPVLLQAVDDFNKLKGLWDSLEQKHLALRDEILNK